MGPFELLVDSVPFNVLYRENALRSTDTNRSMTGIELDEVDRSILHGLQADARTTTAEEMGEKAKVSASTIRNRIKRLEDAGVIEGYHPHIDYEAANYQLHLFII